MGNRKEEAQEFILERERERENRAEQSTVGANVMVGDGGRLVGASARGVYFRTAGLFCGRHPEGGGATACGRRPKGRVQRPVIVETTYLISHGIEFSSKNRSKLCLVIGTSELNWNKGPCKAELSVGLSL